MIIKFSYTLVFLIIVNIILFSPGCKNNIVSPPLSNKNIDTAKSYTHFLWPSKKGDYWDYNYYSFSFGNNDTNWTYKNFGSFGLDLDTTDINGDYRLEITDVSYFAINDTLFPCQVITSYFNDIDLNFNEIYWIGKIGVYSMGAFDNTEDTILKKEIFIPNEIEKNKPWKAQSIFKGPSGFSSVTAIDKRLISINDTIIGPAGKFSCYVIRTIVDPRQDYPGYYYYYEYYMPEIGLIAKVRIFILPNAYWFLDYIYILKNYNLN